MFAETPQREGCNSKLSCCQHCNINIVVVATRNVKCETLQFARAPRQQACCTTTTHQLRYAQLNVRYFKLHATPPMLHLNRHKPAKRNPFAFRGAAASVAAATVVPNESRVKYGANDMPWPTVMPRNNKNNTTIITTTICSLSMCQQYTLPQRVVFRVLVTTHIHTNALTHRRTLACILA